MAFELGITVRAPGASITTSGVTASVSIPVNAAGNAPRYVYIACTAAAHIRAGAASVTATTTDLLLNNFGGIVLNVAGCTTIAAIQNASAGTVKIVPLED